MDHFNFSITKSSMRHQKSTLHPSNSNSVMKNAFGENGLNSYIKLKKSEIESFKSKEKFDKQKPITKWERSNTLDC